nr:MAG TPA: hypothetical protein [Caudoviricetes sp.]
MWRLCAAIAFSTPLCHNESDVHFFCVDFVNSVNGT